MKKLITAGLAFAAVAGVYATSCDGCGAPVQVKQKTITVKEQKAIEVEPIEIAKYDISVVYNLKFTLKTLVAKSVSNGGCTGWYFEQGTRKLEGILWQCLYKCEDTDALSGEQQDVKEAGANNASDYPNGDNVLCFQYSLWEKSSKKLFTDGITNWHIGDLVVQDGKVYGDYHLVDCPAAIQMLRFSKKANKAQVIWGIDTWNDINACARQITLNGKVGSAKGASVEPFDGATYVGWQTSAEGGNAHLDVFQAMAAGFGSTTKVEGNIIPKSVCGNVAGRIVPIAKTNECRGKLVDFCREFTDWCNDGDYAAGYALDQGVSTYFAGGETVSSSATIDPNDGDELVAAFGTWSMKYAKKFSFAKEVPSWGWGDLTE